MTATVVIRAEGLGKKYIISHRAERERYTTLRDVIARSVKDLARSTSDLFRREAMVAGGRAEEFWALKEVNFEIKRGEVIGIIGRNGAGKSTLLKILSRITEPSEGRVTIKGRVASLLEVGTGFHPELSGRENIYLNGAILGMTRAEIKRKFDEIVSFAEVEKFLDTPVKRYSSGMYVRLAFAVAAHLEPEILVVDEVLAVGDAEFQKKCLGRMSEVARGGRTVLFVSHNMGAIASLCATSLLLQRGRLASTGPTHRIIESYSSGLSTRALRVVFPARADVPSITGVSLDDAALRRGDFSASIEFVSPYPLRRPVGGIVVSSTTGAPIWGTNGRIHPNGIKDFCVDRGILTCQTSAIPLAPSMYMVSAYLGDWHQDFDEKLNVFSFEFKVGSDISLRPSSSVIGHMDWRALWKLNGPDERNRQFQIPGV